MSDELRALRQLTPRARDLLAQALDPGPHHPPTRPGDEAVIDEWRHMGIWDDSVGITVFGRACGITLVRRRRLQRVIEWQTGEPRKRDLMDQVDTRLTRARRLPEPEG